MGHADDAPSCHQAEPCKQGEQFDNIPLLPPAKGAGNSSAPDCPPAGPYTGAYNQGFRAVRDTKWRNAYIGSMLAFVVGGCVSCALSDNKRFFNSSNFSLDVCSDSRGRALREDDGLDGLSYNHPAWPIVLAGSWALATGWLFLLGFKHRPKLMVHTALVLVVAIPLLQGIIMAVYGIVAGAIVGFIVSVILAITIYFLRSQVELVTRLLGISSKAILEMPGIIGLGVCLQCLYVFFLVPVFAIFAVEALATGKLVRNPVALKQSQFTNATGEVLVGSLCVDAAGMPTTCCQFETGAWGIVYLLFWSVVVVWTGMLLGQVQRFSVAGAVAQWYFTPAWVGPSTGVDKPGQGRVMKSLRHALGPSFGSLCASAAVLGVINMLQELLKFCQRQIRRPLVGLAFLFLAFLLRSLLSLVEFLTHMTTARMALTGEAFFDAAHSTYAIMKRNGLESLGVWWLPRYILGACAFAVSSLYAVLIFLVADLSWHGDGFAAFLVALAGWWICCLVLSFMSSLLVNAVDGAFMCFLMDRDAACVTRQDVHQVLQAMPGIKGQVVELPDGEIMYAAPAAHQQQQNSAPVGPSAAAASKV